MKDSFGQFSEGVTELAHEMWEFRTCQRGDGSYYGTAGQCRKGTETTKPEKKEKKGEGSGDSSFAMDKNSFNARTIANKLGSISTDDPAMAEFKTAADKFVEKTEVAGAKNRQELEKIETAGQKASERLDKINDLDDKARDLRDKANEMDDVEKWAKTVDKANKIDEKVEKALEKEFPDFKKAREDAQKAFDEWDKDTKGELTDESPKKKEWKKKVDEVQELKLEKLGGKGYEEIEEIARDKAYWGSKSKEFETGQGIQTLYGKGDPQKFVTDADKVTEKAIAGLQKKYPDFMPDQSPKQIMAQLGIGDGGGRAQSNEMFYQNNAVSALVANGAISRGFGFDGDSGGKTFKDYFGNYAMEITNDSVLYE